MNNEYSWCGVKEDVIQGNLKIDMEKSDIRSKFLIENKLIAIRKVKQDKNTLYRIALISTIEFAVAMNDYSKIVNLLDQVSKIVNTEEYAAALNQIKIFIEHYNYSDEPVDLNSFKVCFQNEEFDNHLSKVSRLITLKGARDYYRNNTDELQDIYLSAILDENQEAEGMIYYFITFGFECNIVELLVIDDIVINHYPNELQYYNSIFLLRQGSTYYHFISIQQMEDLRLNVATDIYGSK